MLYVRTVYTVRLTVILIGCLTISNSIIKLVVHQLMCVMSNSQGIYIAKLNVRQFAFDSNLPNLMFAKCIVYTVLHSTYIHIVLYRNGIGHRKLTESQCTTICVNNCCWQACCFFVFTYSMLFLLYRLHGY